MPPHLLVVASETPDQQAARRARTGQASHESLADTLRAVSPGCAIDHISCVDGGAGTTPARLRGYDGVLLAGSPIQMHEDTPEVRSAAAFMGTVFEAGRPAFGSCAGLQIAAVAAGGTVRPRDGEMEAGFARGIVATGAGQGHPMLRGRPGAWDAPAMHSAVVERMPAGGTVLARAAGTSVEAAEIRVGDAVFWGTQYHPEIGLSEIGDALRRQSAALVEQGLAESDAAIEAYAGSLETLESAPNRRDLSWQLGLDAEVIDPERRRREIANFLAWIGVRG